jgi:tRNA pseudouridine38-40 synthase
MLLPPKPGSKLADMLVELRENSPLPNASFWDGMPTGEDETENSTVDLPRKRAWRVPLETLGSFRSLAKQYEGTHCFHNYTVGRDFSDRAAQRYMIRLEASGFIRTTHRGEAHLVSA